MADEIERVKRDYAARGGKDSSILEAIVALEHQVRVKSSASLISGASGACEELCISSACKELCISCISACKELCISTNEPYISEKEPTAKEPCVSEKEPDVSAKKPSTRSRKCSSIIEAIVALQHQVRACVHVYVCACAHTIASRHSTG